MDNALEPDQLAPGLLHVASCMVHRTCANNVPPETYPMMASPQGILDNALKLGPVCTMDSINTCMTTMMNWRNGSGTIGIQSTGTRAKSQSREHTPCC